MPRALPAMTGRDALTQVIQQLQVGANAGGLALASCHADANLFGLGGGLLHRLECRVNGVITSYSIHYTKLYD